MPPLTMNVKLMMKTSALLFIAAALTFFACNKKNGKTMDYACKCDNGKTYTIQVTSAAQATNACDEYDNICPSGVQCVTHWDCSLD